MNLNDQYAGACTSWVRYSRYEFRQFPDGVRVIPAADAVPQLYNPLETAWEMPVSYTHLTLPTNSLV